MEYQHLLPVKTVDRICCLDLRVDDSDAITSYVEGGLFQDMLLKSEEMGTYGNGGLGMRNVKMRAMSMLIHTFLAQAISPTISI